MELGRLVPLVAVYQPTVNQPGAPLLVLSAKRLALYRSTA